MKSHALASFWRCYEELAAHVQRLARKNFELFKANPRHPSLRFQKKGGVYTVEVGRSYRGFSPATIFQTLSGFFPGAAFVLTLSR